MGIDLQIRGRYARFAFLAADAQTFLTRVQAWWQQQHGELLIPANGFLGLWNGTPALGLSLHPGAENVAFTVPRRGHVEVTAKTSTAGPGYHMFVCDALHALGEALHIRWDEPHEQSYDVGYYFYTRNPSDVHEEMRTFIRNLARIALSDTVGDALQLSMPAGWRFEMPDAYVLTPLGPRDRAWLEGASVDGNRGIDIFPWWHRGAGPHYWLGRALVQMWSEVRWCEPFTEEQTDVLCEVHAALATAYRKEARLTYPWRAWSEIARWLSLDDELAREIHAKAAAAAETPLIGYRRHDVIAEVVDSWTVRVPGAFAQEWDDGTWVAWEPGRGVRVATYTCAGGGPARAAKETRLLIQRQQAEVVVLADGRSAALYRTGDSWTLQGAVAGDDFSVALLTVTFEDEAHRPWAIATHESLRWAAPAERQTHVADE